MNKSPDWRKEEAYRILGREQGEFERKMDYYAQACYRQASQVLGRACGSNEYMSNFLKSARDIVVEKSLESEYRLLLDNTNTCDTSL